VFTKVEHFSISSRARQPLIFFFCDLDLEVRVMKAVRDTPSSDGACVCVSSNYLERIKSYGPDKQISYFTFDHELDIGVFVMKALRETPSCDGACVYKVSSNYLERIKRYGPDKQKVTVFDLEL
jgi:hypothetical protein